MTDWLARARSIEQSPAGSPWTRHVLNKPTAEGTAEVSEGAQVGTDKGDETPISSVLTPAFGASAENDEQFEERAAILEFDAGLARDAAEAAAREGVGLDRAPLDAAGSATDARRVWRAELRRRGYSQQAADELAMLLEARAADMDDRISCIQCRGLSELGRCMPAQEGRVHGADRRLEPVLLVLHRCEAFAPRPGVPS